MATRKAEAESLEGLATFLEPFSALVRRSESEHALERYTTGLLSDLPRKTAADIGRALPGTDDRRLQEFTPTPHGRPGRWAVPGILGERQPSQDPRAPRSHSLSGS